MTLMRRASADAGIARRPVVRAGACLLTLCGVACAGCQAIVPSAVPGALAWREDAKIAAKAKAEGFPTPADVGLTSPNETP
jgi:hypothetical protein